MNKNARVLIENRSKDNKFYFGRDEFNNSVIVKSDKDITGKIQNIHITNFNQNTFIW